MKNFIRENSSAIVKFITTHIVMSLLGIMVGLAVLVLEGDSEGISLIAVIAGLFLLGFMCFLHYDDMYFLAEKEGIRLRGEKKPIDYKKGVKVTLIAYSPVIIVAVILVIFRIISIVTGNDDPSAIPLLIYYACQGTFIVFASWTFTTFGNIAGVFVFVIISLLPAFISSVLGYTMGLKDITLRSLFGIKVKPPYDGPLQNNKSEKNNNR